MEKEPDDICANCPNIDVIKRHKQQVGAIREYTEWLKKQPRASYFFLFRLYAYLQNEVISPNNKFGSVISPKMDRQMSVFATTSETTSSTNAVPGNAVTGNETEKHENAVPTTLPVSRSAMPRHICGLPRVFHRNHCLPVPEKSRCAPCILTSTAKLYGSAPVTC